MSNNVEADVHAAEAVEAVAAEEVGAVAVSEKKGRLMKILRLAFAAPGFIHLLWVYVVAYLLVPDLRYPFINFWGIQLSMVETFYVWASITSLLQMLEVSQPGVDNTSAVKRMYLTTGLFLILFVVGVVFGITEYAFGTPDLFSMFRSTEFFVILCIMLVRAKTAVRINSRTLMRHFASGGDLG